MSGVKFEQLHSGIKLWDNKNKVWQKVLRVYLWEQILKDNPNRYYIKKLAAN